MSTRATFDPTSTKKPLSPSKIIAAACIGNALEWYDIAIYGYFAVYIARVFSPMKIPPFRSSSHWAPLRCHS